MNASDVADVRERKMPKPPRPQGPGSTGRFLSLKATGGTFKGVRREH